MSLKIILDEQGVLNLLEEINNKGIINLRYYINVELESNYLKFEKKLEVIKEKYPAIYNEFIDSFDDNYKKFKETAKQTFIYMSNLIKDSLAAYRSENDK